MFFKQRTVNIIKIPINRLLRRWLLIICVDPEIKLSVLSEIFLFLIINQCEGSLGALCRISDEVANADGNRILAELIIAVEADGDAFPAHVDNLWVGRCPFVQQQVLALQKLFPVWSRNGYVILKLEISRSVARVSAGGNVEVKVLPWIDF